MQITVTVEDKQVKLALSEPMIFPNFLDYMQTAILTFMNATVDKSPKNSDLVALREQIYDTYNQSASNVLAIFAPDIEMRPHLTAQAIIEAENKIIEEGRAPALNPFGPKVQTKSPLKTKKLKR